MREEKRRELHGWVVRMLTWVEELDGKDGVVAPFIPINMEAAKLMIDPKDKLKLKWETRPYWKEVAKRNMEARDGQPRDRCPEAQTGIRRYLRRFCL